MKKKIIIVIILLLIMIVSGCIFYYFKNQTEELQPEKMDILGSEVYVYMPKVKKMKKFLLSLLFMAEEVLQLM